MILILLGAIIGCILGVKKSQSCDYHDLGDDLFTGFFGMMFGGFLGMIIAFMLPMKLKETYKYANLGSIQDNSSLNGSFFLGSGNIDNKPVFSFYTEKDGIYKLQQVDANKSTIKYTNSSARLVIITMKEVDFDSCTMNIFALDYDLGKERYLFEVPKGSIKNDYTLDAK